MGQVGGRAGCRDRLTGGPMLSFVFPSQKFHKTKLENSNLKIYTKKKSLLAVFTRGRYKYLGLKKKKGRALWTAEKVNSQMLFLCKH